MNKIKHFFLKSTASPFKIVIQVTAFVIVAWGG